MKITIFRPAIGLTACMTLAACGAGAVFDQPVQIAALVDTGNATAQAMPEASTATMPAPDCAAQNCRGLRIIDGNAETYRYDAMRRATAADGPQA